MTRSVRELNKNDVHLIIDYFLSSTPEHLLKLGVDARKLPNRNDWNKIILGDLQQPLEKRKFYYIIWELDDKPVGHSNINDIVFGSNAYMHLHLWNSDKRQKGNGTYFVTESLKYYFEKFKLQKIFCQPNAMNDAPNKTLEKVGFEFVKKYETIPGWLNFKQFVNLWVLDNTIKHFEMDKILDKVKESAAFLAEKGFGKPLAGIVLGTGLGVFAGKIKTETILPYNEIPYFPVSTVEFHKGQLVYGNIGNNKVIAMQGRFHYYEGYTMQQITFPIRVMKELGIEYLLLSNAAGSLNKKFRKGDLVIIEDHINLHPDNPLRGLNEPEFGNRFVDMSEPYDKKLNKLLKKCAKQCKLKIQTGIYASVTGPNLETKAEYKYLRLIGADMVGMSTVPEVIVANHIGLKCAAISVITDECNPENLKPVSIEEIIKVAGKADIVLSSIFENAVKKM